MTYAPPAPVVIVGPTLRNRARALVARLSVERAAAALGVSRNTLLRIVGGVGVRRGSALLVEQAIERLEGGK